MEGLLRWLLDEIEDILKFQKRCLPEKAKSFEKPRVYFLKVLPKPNEAPNNTLFKGVCRKFNNSLQNMLQTYHLFGFINVHEITTRPKDQRFFISNTSGILSDEGAIQFWESISQTFKAIDAKIKPKSITRTQGTQWDPRDCQKKNSDREGREKSHSRSSYSSYYDQPHFKNQDRYQKPHYRQQDYYY